MQAIVQLFWQRALNAAAGPAHVVVVGYAMKASREQQLAEQGLLPLVPQPAPAQRRLSSRKSGSGGGADGGAGCSGTGMDGGVSVMFMPLDLRRPLAEQGHVDVVLHKASDELVAAGGGAVPQWSTAMEALQCELRHMPHVCVVDPFEATAKVGATCSWGADMEVVTRLRVHAYIFSSSPETLHSRSIR